MYNIELTRYSSRTYIRYTDLTDLTTDFQFTHNIYIKVQIDETIGKNKRLSRTVTIKGERGYKIGIGAPLGIVRKLHVFTRNETPEELSRWLHII